MVLEQNDDLPRRSEDSAYESSRTLFDEYLSVVAKAAPPAKTKEPEFITFDRLDAFDDKLKGNQTPSLDLKLGLLPDAQALTVPVSHQNSDKSKDSKDSKDPKKAGSKDDDQSDLMTLLFGLGAGTAALAVLKGKAVLDVFKGLIDSSPSNAPYESRYRSPVEQKISELQSSLKGNWRTVDPPPAQLALEKLLTAEAASYAKQLGLPADLVTSRLEFGRIPGCAGVVDTRTAKTIIEPSLPDVLATLRHELRHYQRLINFSALRQADPEAFQRAMVKELSVNAGDGKRREIGAELDGTLISDTRMKLTDEGRRLMREALAEYFTKNKNASQDGEKQITSVLSDPKYEKLVKEMGGSQSGFWEFYFEVRHSRFVMDQRSMSFNPYVLSVNPAVKEAVDKQAAQFKSYKDTHGTLADHPMMNHMLSGVSDSIKGMEGGVAYALSPEEITARRHQYTEQIKQLQEGLKQSGISGKELGEVLKREAAPLLRNIGFENAKEQLVKLVRGMKNADTDEVKSAAKEKAQEKGLQLLKDLGHKHPDARKVAQYLLDNDVVTREQLPSSIASKVEQPAPGKPTVRHLPTSAADSPDYIKKAVKGSLQQPLKALKAKCDTVIGACENLELHITPDSTVRDVNGLRKSLDRLIAADPTNSAELVAAVKGMPVDLKTGDKVPPAVSTAIVNKRREYKTFEIAEVISTPEKATEFLQKFSPVASPEIRAALADGIARLKAISPVRLTDDAGGHVRPENPLEKKAVIDLGKIQVIPSPIDKIDIAPELRKPALLEEFAKSINTRMRELQQRGSEDASTALTEMVREFFQRSGIGNPAFGEERFEIAFDKTVKEPGFKYFKNVEGNPPEELTVKDREFFDKAGQKVSPEKVRSILLVPETLLTGHAPELAGQLYKACMQQTGKPGASNQDIAGIETWVNKVLDKRVELVEDATRVKTGKDGYGLDKAMPSAPSERAVTVAVTDKGIKLSSAEGEREISFAQAYKEWHDKLEGELQAEKNKGNLKDDARIADLEKQIAEAKNMQDLLSDGSPKRGETLTQVRAAFEKASVHPKLEDLAKHHGGGQRGRMVALTQLARTLLLLK